MTSMKKIPRLLVKLKNSTGHDEPFFDRESHELQQLLYKSQNLHQAEEKWSLC